MSDPGPTDLGAAFAVAMGRLGPFEDAPTLAVAVSGGADSMALALLAQGWVAQHGGSLHALVVDHGLRAEAAAEASLTIARLTNCGIDASLLVLTNLPRGPSLAERARTARYRVLSSACRTRGILHLLLGHHEADQAETLMMRVLRQSGTSGLAGMAALTETHDVRLLRPLLGAQPNALRQFLQIRGVAWVEDPSNRDPSALRSRLRMGHGGSGLAALSQAARTAGLGRVHAEEAIAAELAEVAAIHPAGFAQLTSRRLSPGALASLIQTMAGAPYPPASGQIAALAAEPRPATVAGARIAIAGTSLVIVREEAAMQAPIAATLGMRWDRRMRLVGAAPDDVLQDVQIGPLGDEAAGFRKQSHLPSIVLRTLPALRRGKVLLAVPHLGYVSDNRLTDTDFRFDPPRPAAGATFRPI